VGASWAKGLQNRLDSVVAGELASVGVLKAAVCPLGADLPGDCRIKGRLRRLAAGRGLVTSLRHCHNQLLASHRLAGFGQHPGSGVQGAELLLLRGRLTPIPPMCMSATTAGGPAAKATCLSTSIARRPSPWFHQRQGRGRPTMELVSQVSISSPVPPRRTLSYLTKN
jgi:hypothetical protein